MKLMYNLVTGEFTKLKRYSILWIGVVTVFCSVLLAAFQSSSGGTGDIRYEHLYNNVIWNNYSLAFPFLIVLIGGYLINREFTDNTLKTVLTLPVSFRRLLLAKMITIGLLTTLFAVLSFLSTFLLAMMFQYKDLSWAFIIKSMYQIIGVSVGNYIAVLPIIVYFSRKRNAFFTGVSLAFVYGFCGIFVAGRQLTDYYPVTAALGLFGYTGQEKAVYQLPIALSSLLLMLVIAGLLMIRVPRYEQLTNKPRKQRPKKHRNRMK